jgi:hypothetical protein
MKITKQRMLAAILMSGMAMVLTSCHEKATDTSCHEKATDYSQKAN